MAVKDRHRLSHLGKHEKKGGNEWLFAFYKIKHQKHMINR